MEEKPIVQLDNWTIDQLNNSPPPSPSLSLHPMDNSAISDSFSLLSKLMEIHGENAFKTRTYSIAAYNIDRLPVQLKDTPREKLAGIKGIGESVGRKVIELLDTGTMAALTEYLQKTPVGVVEMLKVKGIGPKKINIIWKEMGIESIGELLYACNENRLSLVKGFGARTQANIIEAIEFYLQQQGRFLYAEIDEILPQVKAYIEKLFHPEPVALTGSFRRQNLIIDDLEFVVRGSNDQVKPKFQTAVPPELLEEKPDLLVYKLKNGLRLKLYTGTTDLPRKHFLLSGSEAFNDVFLKMTENKKDLFDVPFSEDDAPIFERAGIPFITPALREDPAIIERAKKKQLPPLITEKDVRGLIHSHSKWSDGANTIEEMADELIRRGYEYLVISDHSKAAFYANGLSEERIREQHAYIDELNSRYSSGKKPFRIFKSIECDILSDGSLDYSDEVLSTFDLVIASIHSNLKMTEEKATARILRAIANPHVRILGHPTGRLLLSRNGYPIDYRKIIDACAKGGVVVEINAHPRRLDLDWQWIPYAREKRVLLSIDPDAHTLEGFDDVRYGVLAAQKGGLTREGNLSSYSLDEFTRFVEKKRTS